MNQSTLPNTSPAQSLQRYLQLADADMKAISTSSTLAEAKRHAEGVVNILVGNWGRWYGDGDGDGNINVPSDQRGVLPGERIPEAAPDSPAAQWPHGLAILAYDAGDAHTQEQVRALIGDVEIWKDTPRAAYDQIASTVTNSDTQRNQVGKLKGSVPRSLAWARLILTKATTLEAAKQFATLGTQQTSEALSTAQTIR